MSFGLGSGTVHPLLPEDAGSDVTFLSNSLFVYLFVVFTCLGVEWLVASGKDSASLGWASCGSPGSVVMVIHLRDSNDTVIKQM